MKGYLSANDCFRRTFLSLSAFKNNLTVGKLNGGTLEIYISKVRIPKDTERGLPLNS